MRPFNGREKDRNAKCIIEMKGPSTIIKNPEDPNMEPKKFAFDFSYWSHDSFVDRGDGYMDPEFWFKITVHFVLSNTKFEPNFSQDQTMPLSKWCLTI